jgi:hypothetical protein
MELAVARQIAPVHLQEAEELLDCLEKLFLAKPICEILRPPRTVLEWRRNAASGRMEKVEISGPSPRQCAESWSRNMIGSLVASHDHLKRARFTAKYQMASYSCWGDLPPVGSVRPLLLRSDFDDVLFLVSQRWLRLLRAVWRKDDLLRFALKMLETYPAEEVFRCRDFRTRFLTREPVPLLIKAHRDAAGVWWSIAA